MLTIIEVGLDDLLLQLRERVAGYPQILGYFTSWTRMVASFAGRNESRPGSPSPQRFGNTAVVIR